MAARRGSVLPRRVGGFTLIELMVVVAMLSIVLSVAAPGLQGFVAGQRVKALAFDLMSDLLFARSEALKRGAAVVVTPAGSGWSAGWTVTAGSETLSSRQSSNQTLQFDGAPGSISFNPWGRVTSPTSQVRMTVRTDAASAGVASRCVELDLSGRARTSAGAC